MTDDNNIVPEIKEFEDSNDSLTQTINNIKLYMEEIYNCPSIEDEDTLQALINAVDQGLKAISLIWDNTVSDTSHDSQEDSNRQLEEALITEGELSIPVADIAADFPGNETGNLFLNKNYSDSSIQDDETFPTLLYAVDEGVKPLPTWSETVSGLPQVSQEDPNNQLNEPHIIEEEINNPEEDPIAELFRNYSGILFPEVVNTCPTIEKNHTVRALLFEIDNRLKALSKARHTQLTVLSDSPGRYDSGNLFLKENYGGQSIHDEEKCHTLFNALDKDLKVLPNVHSVTGSDPPYDSQDNITPELEQPLINKEDIDNPGTESTSDIISNDSEKFFTEESCSRLSIQDNDPLQTLLNGIDKCLKVLSKPRSKREYDPLDDSQEDPKCQLEEMLITEEEIKAAGGDATANLFGNESGKLFMEESCSRLPIQDNDPIQTLLYSIDKCLKVVSKPRDKTELDPLDDSQEEQKGELEEEIKVAGGTTTTGLFRNDSGNLFLRDNYGSQSIRDDETGHTLFNAVDEGLKAIRNARSVTVSDLPSDSQEDVTPELEQLFINEEDIDNPGTDCMSDMISNGSGSLFLKENYSDQSLLGDETFQTLFNVVDEGLKAYRNARSLTVLDLPHDPQEDLTPKLEQPLINEEDIDNSGAECMSDIISNGSGNLFSQEVHSDLSSQDFNTIRTLIWCREMFQCVKPSQR